MMKRQQEKLSFMNCQKRDKNGYLIRDDSPNSVISHNGTLSHRSSASGSTEHKMFRTSMEEEHSSTCSSPSASSSDSDSDTGSKSNNDAASNKTKMVRFKKVLKGNVDDDLGLVVVESDMEVCKTRMSSSQFQNSSLISNDNVQRSSQNSFTSVYINSPSDGDPIMCSFSAALKECHIRKLQARIGGFKALPEYEDLLQTSSQVSTPFRFKERRRPASMDLVAEINPGPRDGSYSCSPRFANNSKKDLKPLNTISNKECLYRNKTMDHQQKMRMFPSPNIYRNGTLGRASIKALPSKWDDAEKWLCSPGTVENTNKSNGDVANINTSNVPKKTKSKSGPLNSLGVPSPVRTLYYSRNRGSLLPPSCTSYQFENRQNQKPSEGCDREDLDLPSCDNALGNSRMVRSNSVDGWSFQSRPMNSLPNTARQSNAVDGDQRDIGYLESRHYEEEKNYDDGSINQKYFSKNGSARESIAFSVFTEFLPEDKHTDTSTETPRFYGSTSLAKQEMELELVENVKSRTSISSTSSRMKDVATEISPTISRRDMATQITPLESSRTSRCTTPQKSISPSRHNTPTREANSENNSSAELLELGTCDMTKLEVTNTNSADSDAPLVFTPGKKLISPWKSKEEEEKESSMCLRYLESGDWRKNIMEARALAWEEAERTKCLSRFKREEAKITAWENHQKAKADADLKKLEMKLEKLRSKKTEKIMNKLDAAKKKAEDMRATIASEQAEHLTKALNRSPSIRKTSLSTTNLGSCFSFPSCNV